jgi:NAD(P)-dependent dehydrogenase (short-subunit alcohol dehydrogenase family)
MDRRFESKVVLVTGGTSGIGRDAAVAFGKEGARVVVAGRRAAEGEETVSLIRSAGGEGLFVRADMSKSTDIQAMVRKCVDTYGRLDCAFNNAGIGGPLSVPLADYDEETWNRIIAVNLTGVFLCMKFEIPEILKSGGGAIVNTSSAAGVKSSPVPGAAYSSSKHGLHGLSTTAALEYASKGIRVNVVCPGVIMTPLTENSIGRDKKLMEIVASKHPVGRVGQPREVSSLVLWLCSEEASFVTGAIIPVDGGQLLL